eukprot:TRINITY_DN3670_c0_g1_i2.p1 TRINITY_DN3670_c0_g1~~TRINITY_DN3670_c0_g1_i2.p1  ORF type:complete len:267 (+),score=53.11 TRINITY_DN3670_c0_g1_i2:711-1511(+)
MSAASRFNTSGQVAFFNLVLNKSHQWGTSPWWWYWVSALPRSCGATLFALPLAARVNPRASARLLFPALLFVAAFSFLPHKELRFIFPAIPLINAAAALGFDWIWNRKDKMRVVWEVSKLLLSLNFTLSGLLLLISSLNYPGGAALEHLHASRSAVPGTVRVHIDVAAAMTGVSRFGERTDGTWVYSKRENLTDFSEFDFLLSSEQAVAGFTAVYTEPGLREILRAQVGGDEGSFWRKTAESLTQNASPTIRVFQQDQPRRGGTSL